MRQEAAARRYARALFELCKERGILDRLVQEFGGVMKELQDNAPLRRMLEHPLVPAGGKRKLVEEVWGGRIDPLLRHLLLLLVDKRREALVESVYTSFRELADREQSVAEVLVTTAAPLGEPVRQTLQERLEAYLGKKVRMKIHEDASLLGGIVVQMGDRRIDGSLRSRLRTLHAAVSGRGTT